MQAEQCFVFVWENDLYVAISAALIGRPIDYPEDTGMKAWEWIARHEKAHVRLGHLPWLFYTRRIFLASKWLFFMYTACMYLQVVDGSWFNSVLAFVAGAWVLQTIVGLACELSADLFATNSVDDVAVLEDSKKALERITYQAQTKLSAPLGKILYFYSTLLLDPHTPLIARKWLLARRAKRLQEALRNS